LAELCWRPGERDQSRPVAREEKRGHITRGLAVERSGLVTPAPTLVEQRSLRAPWVARFEASKLPAGQSSDSSRTGSVMPSSWVRKQRPAERKNCGGLRQAPIDRVTRGRAGEQGQERTDTGTESGHCRGKASVACCKPHQGCHLHHAALLQRR